MKHIKIIDITLCEQCKTKTCCFADAISRTNSIYKLVSETTVCPVSLLIEGPSQYELNNNILDEPLCIDCALCTLSCSHQNLIYTDKKDNTTDFDGLNEKQYNAIANSYLHYIFEFAANTNRNRSINFNGYCVTHSGIEAFVEIDYNNDSLECVRRLLGDMLLYKPTNEKIINGIVVLKELPKQGTHDVITLVNKIQQFPKTNNLNIYLTTFSMLKFLAINIDKNNHYEFADLLYSLNETPQQYISKIETLIQK